MPVKTVAHAPEVVGGDDRTADQRWAAWIAKGLEHDRKIRKRIPVVAAVLVAGAVVAAGVLLFR